MKTTKYILQLVLVSLVLLSVSCARSFDNPPLNEPEFTPDGRVLTIKEYKEKFAHLKHTETEFITQNLYLAGRVTANDISGNIFKQIYIQDATGALSIGIDQNNLSNDYVVGQLIYVKLKELYAVNYGDQLQVGYDFQANRLPLEISKEHLKKDGWADKSEALPTVRNLSELTPEMASTLVKLEGVKFVNGGTGYFITPGENYTAEVLTDVNNKRVPLRTSEYFSAMKGVKLPEGYGTVVGILGRHYDNWQLILRDTGDVINFGGETPGGGGGETPKPDEPAVFLESFGEQGSSRLKVGAYTDWKMKSPIVYSDRSGRADIRALADNSHLWLPAGVPDSYLTIEGISTKDMQAPVLSFRMAASLFDAASTGNLNVITIVAGDKTLVIPSKPVSNAGGDNNKFYDIELEGFPIGENIKLEFQSGATNLSGIRIDDIKIAEKSSTIVPEPSVP